MLIKRFLKLVYRTSCPTFQAKELVHVACAFGMWPSVAQTGILMDQLMASPP